MAEDLLDRQQRLPNGASRQAVAGAVAEEETSRGGGGGGLQGGGVWPLGVRVQPRECCVQDRGGVERNEGGGLQPQSIRVAAIDRGFFKTQDDVD